MSKSGWYLLSKAVLPRTERTQSVEDHGHVDHLLHKRRSNRRKPADRLISLYTSAERAKAGAVEEEAGKLSKEKESKQTEFIEAAADPRLEVLAI